MRRPYSLPPGYDGNRFTTSGGEVSPVEDSAFTLSVDGIPTSLRREEQSAAPRQSYRSRLPGGVYRGKADETRRARFAESGMQPHLSLPASDNSADVFIPDDPLGTTFDEADTEQYTKAFRAEAAETPVIAEILPDVENHAGKERHSLRQSPRKTASRRNISGVFHRKPTAPHSVSPLSALAGNEDMLLILLIFLLSGEGDASGIVPVLALLLAVR